MAGYLIRYCALLLVYLVVDTHGRHVDNERDYVRCKPGEIPVAIKNSDGFLKLTCIPPRCEDIKKVQAICTPTFTNGCPKGCWVGGLHREFIGANEKAVYKTQCCSHPIFQKTIAIKPQPDFQPGAEANDAALGQGDIIDIVTNVLPHSQFDHHTVEVTSILCRGSTTTQRSTIRPTTKKPNSKERSNNNGVNVGGGGGGGGGGQNGNGGSNGGNNGGNPTGNNGGSNGNGGNNGGNNGGSHGGNNGGSNGGSHGGNNGGNNGGNGGNGGGHGGHSGGHGGRSGGHGGHSGAKGGHSAGKGGHSAGKGGHSGGQHGGSSQGHGEHHSENGCGPTGCSQPKLEGGADQHYAKQNVPLPGKPPASASDPKAWGIDNHGHGGGGGGGGCFTADTLVHTRTGAKRMDALQVGDEVLSSASWDGNSAISYQPVTQFIHKDPDVHTRYTVITTASGRSLSLTPYHLLPQFECHLLERPQISVREYEILFTQSAKFANKARGGQCVLVVNSEGKLVAERISNVTSAVRQGVFSPITASGIIVANGVQASCYSSVENHALQHAFFNVLHKVSQVWKPYLDYVGQYFTGPVQDDGQIPYLLRAMLVLSNLVMGSY